MRRLLVCAGIALLLPPGVATAADAVDFVRDVKPLLAKHCSGCHGAKKQRAGLRLDSGAGLLAGGDSGPAVVPGKSAASLLIKAVAGIGDVTRMPPDEPRLSPGQVDLLKAWIDQGAKVPKDETVSAPARVESDHWAFRAPVRPALPRVKNTAWVRNGIDRFILARLEKEGLTPAPEADCATLIRRLSLDLTGLPPSPREVDDFLTDKRPDAYERLVDRLLSSPHYGERWGRHWLDQARYADSNGYNGDGARPMMWRYRDWVIAALNRDLPFDQFSIEQLAGDLLPSATTEQKIASGFHRNTTENQEGGNDAEQYRNERVVDRVATTGAVWLGLTLGCAQCHDHKYDPISQRDFFRLFAFFNNADEVTLEVASPQEVAGRDALRAKLKALQQEQKANDVVLAEKLPAWEKGLDEKARRILDPNVQAVLALPHAKRSDQQQKLLLDAYLAQDAGRRQRQAAITELQKREPRFPAALVMQERTQARPTHVQIRGDFLRKGAVVAADVPAVLPPLSRKGAANRLDLARFFVDGNNPLTARVTVNRIWQQYFGLGLVETENDFGTRGSPPSHPELLDWLAVELPARGWSLKAMHRLIITSATYRQSSDHRRDVAAKDPGNRLLARQSRLRLEAEIIRDGALAASGLLTARVGGPSVFPPQPGGLDAFNRSKKNWRADVGSDRYRRGMYTHFWRSFPHPSLTVFDAPDSLTTCTKRTRSTTPQQALTLANDEAFVELAEGLADRVMREESSDSRRIRHVFRLCLAREPSDDEARMLQGWLERVRKQAGQERRAWVFVGRVLLNLDEFITRE